MARGSGEYQWISPPFDSAMGKYPLQYAIRRKSGSIVFGFDEGDFIDRTPGSGNRDYHFADALPGLQKSLGFNNLVEWEYGTDNRSKNSLFIPLQQL